MTIYTHFTSDDAAALQANFASANIKLVKGTSPAWRMIDKRWQWPVNELEQVPSYRLLINGRDTNIFVHRSLRPGSGQWDRRNWTISAANGKMVDIPGMFDLPTRREAIAVAFALDLELTACNITDRGPLMIPVKASYRRLRETWQIVVEVNNA